MKPPVALVPPSETPEIKPIVNQSVVNAEQTEASNPQIDPRPETPVEPIIAAKVVKVDIKSSKPQISADEQLQRAVTVIKNRRWPEAETLLQGLIDGPQDLAARTHLLGVYGQNGQNKQFSALVRESIQRYPQQSLFKTEYARSLIKRNAYQSVIEFLQNINNADATQYALLAASYQRLDQHQQAVRYYRQSLDKDGGNVKNWIGLGISQEQITRSKDALLSYRTAIKLGYLSTRLRAFVEKRIRQLEQALN